MGFFFLYDCRKHEYHHAKPNGKAKTFCRFERVGLLCSLEIEWRPKVKRNYTYNLSLSLSLSHCYDFFFCFFLFFRFIEWMDCCCAGTDNTQNAGEELLFPVSTVLPCRDSMFQHPRSKFCDLLAQLPSFMPLDSGYICSHLFISTPLLSCFNV